MSYTKDVTLGEDASFVHARAGPTVMALRRAAALSLLRRAHVDQPTAALALVIQPPPTHA